MHGGDDDPGPSMHTMLALLVILASASVGLAMPGPPVAVDRAPHVSILVCGDHTCDEANHFVVSVSLNNTILLRQAAEQLNVSKMQDSYPWVQKVHVICTEVRKGTADNLNHTWHCARDRWAFFAEGNIKCDGTPALVDADLERYLQRGLFCPWSSSVLRCTHHCKAGLPIVPHSTSQYLVSMTDASKEQVDAARARIEDLPDGTVSRVFYGPLPLIECQIRDGSVPAVEKLDGVHKVLYDLPTR